MKICVPVLFGMEVSALTAGESFTVAERGKSPSCAIAVAADASEAEKYAAGELRTFVRRMTGVELPMVTGNVAAKRERAVVLRLDASIAGHPDAFRLTVDGGRLLITGGGGRGVLYGVYELLERFGGCDWFAPWCEKVPELDSFEVPLNLDFADKPAFDGRYTTWRHTFRESDNERFNARLRYNGRNTKSEYGGPAVKYARNLRSDGSIGRIVVPKEHFERHPEWFCEIDGKRQAFGAWQICYSNPEVLPYVIGKVREYLREEKDATAVSIAQNDCAGWCRCAECKACADEEGSQSGPNIKFANAVAEAIEEEFPDAMITTFAYQHTRRAPKKIRPRRNVMVVLCSFECSFSEPFERSRHPNTMKFREDLRGWGAICRNLRIYDYCVNFSNYLHPFPDLGSIAPNYRFFRDNGARWIGSQGGGDGYHADLAELKTYLMAKMMWNPDQPVAPVIKRFLDGYYGAASPFVKNYIKKLYAAFGRSKGDVQNHNPEKSGLWSGIYSENLPLEDAELKELLLLWHKAEASVKDDPVRLYNVRMGRLPVLYAMLKRRYERNYKEVWLTETPSAAFAEIEAMKPLASEFNALCDEAEKSGRKVSLSETYKTRHVVLKENFRKLEHLSPPEKSGGAATVSADKMLYSQRFGWQLPIRLIACDPGVKYRVRAHLRMKAEESRTAKFGDDRNYAFAGGLVVRWLPSAPGQTRKEVCLSDVSRQDWRWYNVGEFDFAELQKLPLLIHDGICLFVQSDRMEMDKIEIFRVGDDSGLKEEK